MKRPACDNFPECECRAGCEVSRILHRQHVGKVDWLLIFCLVVLALFGVMALTDVLPAEWFR
jgi:hypothetical protein